jgi:hypothetical protein
MVLRLLVSIMMKRSTDVKMNLNLFMDKGP